MDRERQLRQRIRILLVAFIIGIVLSGLTAFPLRWEMNSLARIMSSLGIDKIEMAGPLMDWVLKVRDGLDDAYGRYPFIAYGTDWLAFGHLMIALAFIGPLRDPVRNVWVVEWGMIACVAVIPTAMICGPIRDIPFFHQLIDCSFGVVGIVPLLWCRSMVLELGRIGKAAAQ